MSVCFRSVFCVMGLVGAVAFAGEPVHHLAGIKGARIAFYGSNRPTPLASLSVESIRLESSPFLVFRTTLLPKVVARNVTLDVKAPEMLSKVLNESEQWFTAKAQDVPVELTNFALVCGGDAPWSAFAARCSRKSPLEWRFDRGVVLRYGKEVTRVTDGLLLLQTNTASVEFHWPIADPTNAVVLIKPKVVSVLERSSIERNPK